MVDVNTHRMLVEPDLARTADSTIDVLVIGGGVAGFSAAIAAAEAGANVLVVTKDTARTSNTQKAQGGVAAVLGDEDSFDAHRDDTIAVGAGLCDKTAVEVVVKEGPDRIRELMDWGGAFDHVDGELSLGLEGGHSKKRIVHAHGDRTGMEVQGTLLRKVNETDRIELHEHAFFVDLITGGGRCLGALVRVNREIVAIHSRATILATGGAGQTYRETTNPPIATGDGLAAAIRAGVSIRDLEFVQFHPTTLYVAGSARHLITEAVRGEGAYLRDMAGERFMVAFHPRAELAPRDVVSRSIARHLVATNTSHVFLDVTHLDADHVRRRFPQLTDTCRLYNLDVSTDLVPIHPSVHYLMGGITAGLDAETSMPGLYACGEIAASGLHGANRLASNSLLEGLVFGRRSGRAAADLATPTEIPDGPTTEFTLAGNVINVPDMLNSIRSLMWKDVGIVRNEDGLERAVRYLAAWADYVFQCRFHDPAGWELANVLTVAHAVASCALHRCESRGAHFRSDYPEIDDATWRRHTVYPDDLEAR